MAKPLTVLHLIDTGGPGGAETIFRSVVTGLPGHRWRSIAVVPCVDWLFEALKADGVMPILLPSLQKGGPVPLFRLRSLLREHEVELVHTHLLGAAVYGSLAAMSAGIPAVCTFHGVPDIPDYGRLLGAKRRILARKRNRIVFVSHGLRDRVLARHPLPTGRIHVVYNGIDPPQAITLGTERSELHAVGAEFVVAAVGNLRPAKDYGTLLRSAALLRAKGVGLRVVIFGHDDGGSLLPSLLRLRKELGVEEIVHFPGFREDVPRLLTACDLVVSSSESEGFSLSTVEAMWLGCPVVATRSGGPEEIIRDGETGVLVPKQNPEALASAILRIRNDSASADAMAAAGKADVRRRFSKSRMLADYQEVYSEVLES